MEKITLLWVFLQSPPCFSWPCGQKSLWLLLHQQEPSTDVKVNCSPSMLKGIQQRCWESSDFCSTRKGSSLSQCIVFRISVFEPLNKMCFGLLWKARVGCMGMRTWCIFLNLSSAARLGQSSCDEELRDWFLINWSWGKLEYIINYFGNPLEAVVIISWKTQIMNHYVVHHRQITGIIMIILWCTRILNHVAIHLKWMFCGNDISVIEKRKFTQSQHLNHTQTQ